MRDQRTEGVADGRRSWEVVFQLWVPGTLAGDRAQAGARASTVLREGSRAGALVQGSPGAASAHTISREERSREVWGEGHLLQRLLPPGLRGTGLLVSQQPWDVWSLLALDGAPGLQQAGRGLAGKQGRTGLPGHPAGGQHGLCILSPLKVLVR